MQPTIAFIIQASGRRLLLWATEPPGREAVDIEELAGLASMQMLRRSANRGISFSDLTPGERILVIAWIAAAGLLPAGGIAVAAFGHGTARVVGIALILIGLICAAVPISPVLRPRVERRRQGRKSG